MKFFKLQSMVPPNGGWWWVHPESGRKLDGSSYNVLMDEIRRFCRANNYPIPPGLDQDVINVICERTPEFCSDGDPPTVKDRLGMFMRAIVEWVGTGAKVTTHEQFEERLAQCKACQYYNGSSSITTIACRKCGCSKLKLFLASEQCPLPEPRWQRIP